MKDAALPTELDIDLGICDREPIHIPGSIQSHGVLLAFDRASRRITHASRNAETFFDTPLNRIIGAPIDAVIGTRSGLDLTAPGADTVSAADEAPTPASRSFGIKLAGLKGSFDSICHSHAGHAILEIEPASETTHTPPLDIVKVLLGKLQQAKTLNHICNETADLLRSLIGFDRVMIYRFLVDGSGQVVAESRAPDLEPLLHLRYPASDIPRQARELYKKSWIRLISDVEATTSPLACSREFEGEPLDLSFAELRSVSPVHIQYLRNMGVAASMSISIVVGGELWGLIACHHRTPRHVGANVRAAAEVLGQVVSLQIQAIEGVEAYVTMRAARTLLDRVVAEFPVGGDLSANLLDRLDQLSGFISSDGAGIWIDDNYRGVGDAPAQTQVRQLSQFIEKAQPGGVFTTHRLVDDFPAAAGWTCATRGVLAVPLSYSDPHYLFFFRGEVLQKIEWAGDPGKPITLGDEGRISPRKSFLSWQEEVRGQSLHWTARDRLIGETLRVYLSDIIIRFSDVIKEERRHAEQRNRLIVNELNHRVKGTLELIQSLVVHGYEEPGRVQEFVRTLEGRIKAIALAHDATSVSHGAEVATLIERAVALQTLAPGQIDISGPSVKLDAKSFTVLALVVHELITHTVELGAFRDPGGRLKVKWLLDGDGCMILHWEEVGVIPCHTVRDDLSLAIIRRNIPHALGGEADVHLHATGLRAIYRIPKRYLTEFPQSKAATSGPRLPITGQARALEGVSVLVVEDHVPAAFDLEQLLYKHGAAAVKIVASTFEALRIVETEPPDVAILDIDLDGETSIPVAEALASRQIPFVFAAGEGDLEQVPPKFRDIDVQLKPWSGEAVVRLLKDALLPHLIRAVLSRLV
jgi:light-regulated signal transduction histidine kinase (bacteriophytochrome)/CheY-like chemotaxis protein